MNQNTRKLEAVICQMMATAIAERKARHTTRLEFVEHPLDRRCLPSLDEMQKSAVFAELDLDVGLPNLSSATAKLLKPYGDIFAYLAFKDMLERMQMYQQLADELCQQDTSEMLGIAPVADAVAA